MNVKVSEGKNQYFLLHGASKLTLKNGECPKTSGIFKVVVWDYSISQLIHLKKVKYECKSF